MLTLKASVGKQYRSHFIGQSNQVASAVLKKPDKNRLHKTAANRGQHAVHSPAQRPALPTAWRLPALPWQGCLLCTLPHPHCWGSPGLSHSSPSPLAQIGRPSSPLKLEGP